MSITRFDVNRQINNEETDIEGSALKDGSYLKADGSVAIQYGPADIDPDADHMMAVANRAMLDDYKFKTLSFFHTDGPDGENYGTVMSDVPLAANAQGSMPIAIQNAVDMAQANAEASIENNLGSLKRFLRHKEAIMLVNHSEKYSELSNAHYTAAATAGFETLNLEETFTDVELEENVFYKAAVLAQKAAIGYSFRNPLANKAAIFALETVADESNIGDVHVALDTGKPWLRIAEGTGQAKWVKFADSIGQTTLDSGLSTQLNNHIAALETAALGMKNHSEARKVAADNAIADLRSDIVSAVEEMLKRQSVGRKKTNQSVLLGDAGTQKVVSIPQPEVGFELELSSMRLFINGFIQSPDVGTRTIEADGSAQISLDVDAIGLETGDKLTIDIRKKSVSDAGVGRIDSVIDSEYAAVSVVQDLDIFED